jgi:hypothetical protein
LRGEARFRGKILRHDLRARIGETKLAEQLTLITLQMDGPSSIDLAEILVAKNGMSLRALSQLKTHHREWCCCRAELT